MRCIYAIDEWGEDAGPSAAKKAKISPVSLFNASGEERHREREFLNDNLLVRIHFIIEMIWWTGAVDV